MRVLGITLPSGKKRFCDARCHNSKKRHCDCICGGLLHGYGSQYAQRHASKASTYVQRFTGQSGTFWLNPTLTPQPRD